MILGLNSVIHSESARDLIHGLKECGLFGNVTNCNFYHIF